jgi:hypothetical protein
MAARDNGPMLAPAMLPHVDRAHASWAHQVYWLGHRAFSTYRRLPEALMVNTIQVGECTSPRESPMQFDARSGALAVHLGGLLSLWPRLGLGSEPHGRHLLRAHSADVRCVSGHRHDMSVCIPPVRAPKVAALVSAVTEERAVFMREQATNMYSVTAYFIGELDHTNKPSRDAARAAKTTIDAPLTIITSAIFSAATYYLVGQCLSLSLETAETCGSRLPGRPGQVPHLLASCDDGDLLWTGHRTHRYAR